MQKEKTFGQYFTPISIAQLMVGLITEGSNSRRILEPSAGKGVFLKILAKKGFQNLTGIEIDPSLVNKSSISLKLGNFFDFPLSEKFDVVIGNPPYVRWKNLSQEQRQYLTSSSFWKKWMNGLSDLLQPFIFKSVSHLVNGGELIFITPIFWMQTLHAEPLRHFLLENGSFEIFINFHETRIFPKANLNLIVFKYRKNVKNISVKVVNYLHKRNYDINLIKRINSLMCQPSLWGTTSTREGNLEFFQTHQPYNSQTWRFLPLSTEEKLTPFESTCHYSPEFNLDGTTAPLTKLLSRNDLKSMNIPLKACKKVKLGTKTYFLPFQTTKLTSYLSQDGYKEKSTRLRYVRVGDIAEIGNGMVSGLDKAFRTDLNLPLNEQEKKLIIPVIKAKAIRRFYPEYLTDYFLIKTGEIANEEILRSEYPNLYTHLKPFKAKLIERYQYDRYIPYWEWVFTRNYKLMKEASKLICVPCKTRFDSRGYFRFALCEKGTFTTQDVTVLSKFSWVKESEEYITAFLNSSQVFEWVTNKGLIRGGVAEFSERPLSSIPFRLINFNDNNEKQIHDRITLIVQDLFEEKKEDPNKLMKINGLISRLI